MGPDGGGDGQCKAGECDSTIKTTTTSGGGKRRTLYVCLPACLPPARPPTQASRIELGRRLHAVPRRAVHPAGGAASACQTLRRKGKRKALNFYYASMRVRWRGWVTTTTTATAAAVDASRQPLVQTTSRPRRHDRRHDVSDVKRSCERSSELTYEQIPACNQCGV